MTKFTVTLLGKEYTLSEQKVQVLFAEGCSIAQIQAYAHYDAFAQASKAGLQDALWEIEWQKFCHSHNGFCLTRTPYNILSGRNML